MTSEIEEQLYNEIKQSLTSSLLSSIFHQKKLIPMSNPTKHFTVFVYIIRILGNFVS